MRGALVAAAVIVATAGAAAGQSLAERHVLAEDLEVVRLSEGVWLHTTWRVLPGGLRFPSNGLVVVSEGHALLVDTAWGDEPTERLVRWVAGTLRARLDGAVLTHAHDDRMGGIGVLKRAGIPTYALTLTAERAVGQGWPAPDSLFESERTVPVGARSVAVFHPGPAHTPDNTVVWLGDERLLFGGCMLRAAGDTSLGNLSDAVVEGWPDAVERLLARYGHARVVVPSHGPIGGPELLDHTLRLAREEAGR